MGFTLKRGDLTKLSKTSGIPIMTVRRYVHGGNIGVVAAKAIDAAYVKLKPARARRQSERNRNTRRRVVGRTVGGSDSAPRSISAKSKASASK